MKRWIIICTSVLCFLSLFLFSCKTPPKEPAVKTPPVQAEPDAAVSSIKEDAPVAAAEPEKVEPDLKSENAALVDEALAARKRAIAAGAEIYLPNELAVIDVTAREAQVVYEAGGDPKIFNETAKDVIYQYKALEEAAFGYKDWERINALGFEKYDPQQFAAGNEAAFKAEEMFNSGAAGKDLYAQVQKGAAAYKGVLNKGFTALAEKERDEILAIKGKADAIKVNIADKDGYNKSTESFTQANKNLTEGKPEQAYNEFVVCKDLADGVYQRVLKKRTDAKSAVDRAKRRLEDSDALADKAETIVPLEEVEALTNTKNAENAEGAQ